MIAILIYAHKNQVQVQRLINKLIHPEVDIFVHADLIFNVDSFENATMIKNRYDIGWGDINILDSIIDSLKEIQNKKYQHYILISGQDYPIVAINKIVSFLKKNKKKEFLSYQKIGNNPGEWNVSDRYTYYHFINNRILNCLSRKIYNKRKFIDGYIPYGGALWWMLTNDAVSYIITKYEEFNLGKKFKKTICMDEVIFQSILCNSKFLKNIENNSYRYVDWSDHIAGKNKGNPNVLTKKDYKNFMSSGNFFARKFELSVDSEVLDMIDEVIQ